MKRDLQLELDPSAAQLVPQPAPQWRYALPIVVLLLLSILAWYAPTAQSMVDIWDRSGTFAHGYVVPLIVLWLAWRKRDELATMMPRPSWLTLAPLALAGFAWLLGELAAVNALSQLALTALVVLTVMCVLGTAIARKLAFPLAFLFFAVPIGEVFMPYLMTWTADFTVAALRLTGIPVYREGQLLVIPTGVWSVVEACSGLRYLIASVMVGTLFAYLMYRSLGRRLMFVGLSIVVPIVANWLRAYMIVMIGHLSNNKLAVGVDHLIYGWLFFGVVIGCLFWIGARWREDHLPPPIPAMRSVSAPHTTSAKTIWSAAAATLVVVVIWKIGYFGVERSDASTRPDLTSVGPIDTWQPSSQSPDSWKPYFLSPSAELGRTFANGPQKVGLTLAYYRNQGRSSKLVSSENALIRSDDNVWVQVRSGTRQTELNGQSLEVRTAELRGQRGQEIVVWQWYWINGQLTANSYSAKAYTALSRLQGRGDDSAGVVIYTVKGSGDAAERALQAFMQAAGPAIETTLRQTRDRR